MAKRRDHRRDKEYEYVEPEIPPGQSQSQRGGF